MRRLSDERGATAVVVAVMAIALLGMVGLAIDAAALYQERRELTNAADAAVLAIAEDCALEVRPCDEATAASTAQNYADRNSRDDTTGIAGVTIDYGGQTVTVETTTRNPDGSGLLRPFFAQVVGYSGTAVGASATAIWGYPRTLRGMLPLIISRCEFPDGTPLPTAERVIYFHDGNHTEPCNAQAGQDADNDGLLAGGFGWLAAGGDCEVTLTQAAWTGADPGSSPTTGCTADDVGSLLFEATPLPIFDDTDGISGTGSGGRYRVHGFVMFHITGYNFGGQYKAPSQLSAPCSGDERCISGYFTTGIVYDGEPGGSNQGIVIVKLID